MPRALIPNSTQVPDVILDQWMAELSGAEFKVLLYVARRTYGFGKESDNISLTQLASGIRRKDGTSLDRGTGLSRSGVKAACNGLIEKGLLIRSGNTRPDGREPEESTYRLNLFASLPDTAEEVGQKKAHPGRFVAYLEAGQIVAQVGQKNGGGRPENNPEVGQKLAPQETEQETEQETASGKPAAVDADLIEALVGEGVFPDVAARLAADKPDRCRECLTWLPYAKPRTTPGRWLANAIEHDFGPPDEFTKRAGEPHKARGAEQVGGNPTQRPQGERHEGLETRLRATYAQVLKTHPDAITAFETFLASERERATKLLATLTERGKRDYLRNADSEDFKLTVFERWLKGEGRRWSRPNEEPQAFTAEEHHDGGSDNPEVKLQHSG